MAETGALSVVLLDIEGTTTPLAFVTRTLFPYARLRLRDYLAENASEPGVQDDLARLQAEYEAENRESVDLPAWEEVTALPSAVAYLEWLMDRDRKSPALKSLQGKIWLSGYESGLLKGEVYADVPPFLQDWKRRGGRSAIYSSGSILAQQLLFRHSNYGDLTPWIDDYFDTGVGPKREAASYTAIAEALGVPPSEIGFVSDTVAELVAAGKAGLRVFLSVRPGNPPVTETDYPLLETLGTLLDS